jgi:hypothetical protein
MEPHINKSVTYYFIYKGFKQMPGPVATPSRPPEAAVEKAKEQQKTTLLSYPEDLGDVFMRLKFYEYDYAAARAFTSTRKLQATIDMPLPNSVVDSSRLEVGGKQVGILGGIAADVATGNVDFSTMGAGIKNAAGQLSGMGESLSKAIGQADFSAFGNSVASMVGPVANAGLYLLRAGVGAIAPTVEQGISAAVGTAVNPQATLVFDGVDLKIHNFEWQFAPKSQTEQQTLDRLIRTIQYHIHPEYATPLGDVQTGIASVDRGLLRYPSMMEVELVGIGGTFNLLFRTKNLMMINQFNVDYTPTGNVELNRGGTPVMTRCSMNLTESTIRTRRDFEGFDQQGVTAENNSTDAVGESDGANTPVTPASESGDNAVDGGTLVAGPGQLIA